MAPIRIESVQSRPAAVVRFEFEPGDLEVALRARFREVRDHLSRSGVDIAGPPFTRVIVSGEGSVTGEAGYPVTRRISGDGRVAASELPGGAVARMIHEGAHEALPEAHHTLQEWIAAQGSRPAAPCWESYLIGPEEAADPAEFRTEISWPLI